MIAVTGAEAMTLTAISALISELTGRTVSYQDETRQQARAGPMRAGTGIEPPGRSPVATRSSRRR
ncbi:MAG TPA: hypothetical protein VES01_10920 [Dermatophilaceae bacterium]|nr:hypothetical protein [Dermatophilaceae bacterium]